MGVDWLFEGQNTARLAQGLWLTARISFISVGLSLIFGTLFGLLMRANNVFVRAVCRFYLETIRIVPILVWLFAIYFGLSTWFNLHISGFWVCIWVFTLWGVAEMVKVGQQIIENALLTNPSASFFVYGLIFILYFLICYPLSLFATRLEHKWES